MRPYDACRPAARGLIIFLLGFIDGDLPCGRFRSAYMSTSKLDTSGIFQALHVHGAQTQLTLSPSSVRIRPHGIEFRADKPIGQWTEMTVDLFSVEGEKVHCTGIVVECSGNRHMGYQISMLFMNLSRQAQERLDLLAFTQR
jgi:hypothetical protein